MNNRIIITSIAIATALLHFLPTTTMKVVSSKAHVYDSTEEVFIDKTKMTSLFYGETSPQYSNASNKLGVTNGGLGSAMINDNNFGDKCCGTSKGTKTDSQDDTIEIFKFGYSSLHFGYLYLEGEKHECGSSLTVACDVGSQKSYPSAEGEQSLFPVLEPSLYVQISLGELFRLNTGISNRYFTESKFSFTDKRELRGVSIYIAFLVDNFNCN